MENATQIGGAGLDKGFDTALIMCVDSAVENYSKFSAGEITAEEMVENIAKDSGKGAFIGFGIGSAEKGISILAEKTGSELLQSASSIGIPAEGIAMGIKTVEVGSAYFRGEMELSEVAYQLGEKAAGYLKDRDVIIANVRHFKKTCLDPTDLEKKMDDARQELIVTEAALRQCIADNAAASITEEEYRMRYDALYEKFQKLEEEKAGLAEKLTALQTEAASVDELINCLQATDELSIEFDPVLWRVTVQKVLVESDDMVRFIMAGGKEYSFRIY